MATTEAYLQRGWGDTIENITMEDVQLAIAEIIETDKEHGAFWVGILDGDEIVLETNKDLTVVGIFPGETEPEIEGQFKSWIEIEDLYQVFLTKNFDKVKAMLAANQ
jgi:hypothetical protein